MAMLRENVNNCDIWRWLRMMMMMLMMMMPVMVRRSSCLHSHLFHLPSIHIQGACPAHTEQASNTHLWAVPVFFSFDQSTWVLFSVIVWFAGIHLCALPVIPFSFDQSTLAIPGLPWQLSNGWMDDVHFGSWAINSLLVHGRSTLCKDCSLGLISPFPLPWCNVLWFQQKKLSTFANVDRSSTASAYKTIFIFRKGKNQSLFSVQEILIKKDHGAIAPMKLQF